MILADSAFKAAIENGGGRHGSCSGLPSNEYPPPVMVNINRQNESRVVATCTHGSPAIRRAKSAGFTTLKPHELP